MVGERLAQSHPDLKQVLTPEGKIDHSFAPFAQAGIHLEWMPKLIRSDAIDVKPDQKVLFLGAGPGYETQTFWNSLPPEVRENIQIYVSEPSYGELALARQRLAPLPGRFSFLNNDAQIALNTFSNCDWIFFDAAIHLLPKKQRPEVMAKIFDALSPGGRAVVVSTFIKDWQKKDEKKLYISWLRRAKEILQKESPELLSIIENVKRKAASTVSDEMQSAEEYRQIFEGAGFVLDFFAHDTSDTDMQVSLDGFLRISQYELWIKGTFPVRAEDESITQDEYERRMDDVSGALQLAMMETFHRFKKGDEMSARNQMVAVLRKPEHKSVRAA